MCGVWQSNLGESTFTTGLVLILPMRGKLNNGARQEETDYNRQGAVEKDGIVILLCQIFRDCTPLHTLETGKPTDLRLDTAIETLK